MSCWYASANDRLQLNTERESTYFQGIIPQENRCFFCTQKAVFQINRQDGIKSLPCFFRPLTAKKNGDFHPETMSFQHLMTQSGAFFFFRLKKVRVIFFVKRVAVSSFSVGISERMIFSKYFLKTPPKNALPFQTSEGVKNFFEKRVSISSPPVGTSERINFFWVFLAEHRFWVCILTPFVQMSERKFYLWFPKHPIIFPFPVRTSEGI